MSSCCIYVEFHELLGEIQIPLLVSWILLELTSQHLLSVHYIYQLSVDRYCLCSSYAEPHKTIRRILSKKKREVQIDSAIICYLSCMPGLRQPSFRSNRMCVPILFYLLLSTFRSYNKTHIRTYSSCDHIPTPSPPRLHI